MRLFVTVILLASCAPDYGECMEPPDEEPSCTTRPELCDLAVTSVIHDPQRARAIDIVFLPDGFSVDELPEFRERVAELIEQLADDKNGIIAVAPQLFNYHRIDLPAERAFAGCLRNDEAGLSDTPFLSLDSRAALFTARANVPEADVVVVMFDTAYGRASASKGGTRLILMNRADGDRVLTHELGHALFDLGDEYSETDACLVEAPPLAHVVGPNDHVDTPNLSRDPAGAKWAHLVRGARPGGGRYGDCIYHPTDACRMKRSEDARFCAVCRDEIYRVLTNRAAGTNAGPPVSSLGTDQDPHAVHGILGLEAMCFDRDHPLTYTLRVDGDDVFTHSTEARMLGNRYPLTLTPGVHSIEAECRDADGLVSTAAMLVRRVD